MVESTGFRGSKIVNGVSQIRRCICSILHIDTSDPKPATDLIHHLRNQFTRVIGGSLILSLSLISTASYALGLGQLNTLSSLNEPFEAEIELLSSTSEELQTVSVQLASPEHFKNAGVDRLYQLSKLKFEIVEDPSRGNYLRITSQEPMREPYLNFLLEVNWAKGRLVREYTALIDPPTYDSGSRIAQTETATSDLPIAKTEPVIAPSNEVIEEAKPGSDFTISQLPDATLVSEDQVQSGEVVAADSTSASPAPTRSSSARPARQDKASETYTTKRGDTLWGIATRERPNPSLSVQQMMLSLLNANPEAFNDNNINSLKTGQVLRVPDTSEVDQITKQEAIALVKEHNDLWDDYRQGLAESVPFRPEGAVTSTGTVDESSLPIAETTPISEPELKLVTAPPEATADESVTATEDNTANVSSDEKGTDLSLLQDELAVAQEKLESQAGENKELKSRLQETEEIITLLKQQVELKNQELAGLQSKLREADQAAKEAAEKQEAEKADQDKLAEESQKATDEQTTETPAAEKEEVVAETPEATEESEDKSEETTSAAEELAAETDADASIDDLLAELDKEQAESPDTLYVNNDDFIPPETADPSIYKEYTEPAENLSGRTGETSYLTGGQEAPSSSTALEPASVEDQLLAEIDTPVQEQGTTTTEQGWLDKLTSFIPAEIADKVPGGVNSVLGILAALLLLVVFGILKLFGGKKQEDEAEMIDLLSPDELAEQMDAEDQQSEVSEEETTLATDLLQEESTAGASDTDKAETSAEEQKEPASSIDDLDDFDFNLDEEKESEEITDSITDEIPDLDETPTDDTVSELIEEGLDDGLDDLDLGDLDSDDEEISLSDMANLEDTLENIKPLLDQTEEEIEEDDPLEEVNISLAYEQYEKAERLVTEAIEKHPEEVGYKLRLLEVHYAANNPVAFESAAKALYDETKGEGHLWESAESMWSELVPERALFEEATEAADTDITDDSGSDSNLAAGLIAGMSAAGVTALSGLNDEKPEDEPAGKDESETAASLDELPDLELDTSLEASNEEFSVDNELDLDSTPDFDLEDTSSLVAGEDVEESPAETDLSELEVDLEQTSSEDALESIADLEASLDENLALENAEEVEADIDIAADQAELDQALDISTSDEISEPELEIDTTSFDESDELADLDVSSEQIEAEPADSVTHDTASDSDDALDLDLTADTSSLEKVVEEPQEVPVDLADDNKDTTPSDEHKSLLERAAEQEDDVFDITSDEELAESSLSLDDVGTDLDLDLTLSSDLSEDDASVLAESSEAELTADDVSLDLSSLDMDALDETNSDDIEAIQPDTEADDQLDIQASDSDISPELSQDIDPEPEQATESDGLLDPLLSATQPGDDLPDLSLSEEVSEVEPAPEIDMLDITAAGITKGLEGTDEQDAQELSELTNELKSDDESVLSDLTASVTDMELSDAISSFTAAEDEGKKEGETDLNMLSLDPNLLSAEELSGDEELDALARSLEDTISGLDGAGLDDMDFEFDPDGELEKTLSSTLGVSSDLNHDFETEADEIDTKLNLAKAYIELGDAAGAKDILNEVSQEGNAQQKQDAQELLSQLS